MTRPLSKISPQWWDYTTLDSALFEDAARLTPDQIGGLSREGFEVVFYDSLEEFYLAEAMEYVSAWEQATADNPVGVCGPIGPTEQLPLVARIVNSLDLQLGHSHFWGMDEWVVEGKEVPTSHPLSFETADLNLCFNHIRSELSMPAENMHFPRAGGGEYAKSWDHVRCAVMQGGQGDAKHWAFNDPPRRDGKHKDNPPLPEEYLRLGTRVVDLHPLTVFQNGRLSAEGRIDLIPTQAITVGPVETWKTDKVSIWHPGVHDDQLGMRLTTLMISKNIVDTAVPMSLMALHPNVKFNFYRPGLHECEAGIT
ncbi:MAG: glucosamine-6-phosphate isomerase [Lentisphaeria bacterium]|nr:glucosamine-6-phosphate isomerase [Lentisphaeria bacterium]